jgi:hypothetical protein
MNPDIETACVESSIAIAAIATARPGSQSVLLDFIPSPLTMAWFIRNTNLFAALPGLCGGLLLPARVVDAQKPEQSIARLGAIRHATPYC